MSALLGQRLALKRRQRSQARRSFRRAVRAQEAMNDYTFTLRFLNPGDDLDSLSVRLYQRLDDASLMGPDADGSFLLEFDRRAPSLPDALTAGLEELGQALPDAPILRVDRKSTRLK